MLQLSSPIVQWSENANSCAANAKEKALLQTAIESQNLRLGRALHSHLLKTSLNLVAFFANRLIHLYAKSTDRCCSYHAARCALEDMPPLLRNQYSWNTLLSAYTQAGLFESARDVLHQMPQPNIVSYNSMISSLSKHGRYKEALNYFRRMQRVGVACDGSLEHIAMDEYTVVSVASVCARLLRPNLLRQLHAAMVYARLNINQRVHNAMINAYGKCGDLLSAHQLFDQMPERDAMSWTALFSAYSCAGRPEEAWVIFDGMLEKSVVTWTALLNGLVQNGREEEAIVLFGRMIREGIDPNHFTFVSALSACANVALINPGKQLHGNIIRRLGGGISSDTFVGNALIDMYAKCGDMGSAMVVFEMMSGRDIITWNSIMTGFARHGMAKQCIDVFGSMERSSVTPNHITFLSLLSACNHACFVDEGCYYFELMKEYGFLPNREHYAVLVDLLGRSHRLAEAVALIEEMPDGGVNDVRCWGSLLAACRIHGDSNLGIRAAKLLLELEPDNVGRYVMLSNVYASAGQWKDSSKARGFPRDRCLVKEPACSWIEIMKNRHTFLVDDKSHTRASDIYLTLSCILNQMR